MGKSLPILAILAILANLLFLVTAESMKHTRITVNTTSVAASEAGASEDGGNSSSGAAASAGVSSVVTIDKHVHKGIKSCAPNERYEKCPQKLCRPQACSHVGYTQCSSHGKEHDHENEDEMNSKAGADNDPCPGHAACVCKKHYVRNHGGVCIPAKECPSCGGDKNATYGCGDHCGRRCSNYNQEPVECPKDRVCYKNSCDCKEGYVFDDYTSFCVKPEDCSLKNPPKPEGTSETPGNGEDENNNKDPCVDCKGKNCDPEKCGTKVSCNGEFNSEPGCDESCTQRCPGPKPAKCKCYKDGCKCKEGFVYDPKVFKCVRPEDCESSQESTKATSSEHSDSSTEKSEKPTEGEGSGSETTKTEETEPEMTTMESPKHTHEHKHKKKHKKNKNTTPESEGEEHATEASEKPTEGSEPETTKSEETEPEMPTTKDSEHTSCAKHKSCKHKKKDKKNKNTTPESEGEENATEATEKPTEGSEPETTKSEETEPEMPTTKDSEHTSCAKHKSCKHKKKNKKNKNTTPESEEEHATEATEKPIEETEPEMPTTKSLEPSSCAKHKSCKHKKKNKNTTPESEGEEHATEASEKPTEGSEPKTTKSEETESEMPTTKGSEPTSCGKHKSCKHKKKNKKNKNTTPESEGEENATEASEKPTEGSEPETPKSEETESEMTTMDPKHTHEHKHKKKDKKNKKTTPESEGEENATEASEKPTEGSESETTKSEETEPEMPTTKGSEHTSCAKHKSCKHKKKDKKNKNTTPESEGEETATEATEKPTEGSESEIMKTEETEPEMTSTPESESEGDQTTEESEDTTTDSSMATSTANKGQKECKGKREFYYQCAPSCPQKTCANYLNGVKIKCRSNAGRNKCKSECRCLTAYYKSDDGRCLTKKQCKKEAKLTTDDDVSTTTENTDFEGTTTQKPKCYEVANELFQVGNLAYTTKLLADVSQRDPGNNVMVGGASILYLLGQLLSGAKGGVKKEILGVTHFENTEQALCYLPKISAKLTANYPDIEYELFCKIYADVSHALTLDFIRSITQKFGIGPENLKFSSAKAAKKMNSDVEQFTNKRFIDFIKPRTLRVLKGLVLVDAESFQGKLEHQFNSAETRLKPFHTSDGPIEKVPTMRARHYYHYAESAKLGAKIVQLKYRGGKFSLIIFLPHAVDGIKELLKKIQNPEDTLSAIKSLKLENIEIEIPKFEISVANRLKVSSEMAHLKKIFKNDTTGLEDIGSADPPFIKEILQKITFPFTNHDKGDKRDIQFTYEEPPRSKSEHKIVLKIDHSFYFEVNFGLITLFAGVVMNP